MQSFGKSQPTHSHQGSQPLFIVVLRCEVDKVLDGTIFFSENRPTLTASCVQSHHTSRCRARPDLIRLCMPIFAVLSVSTFTLTFKEASASSCTDRGPSSSCRSAGESHDELGRATEVDGMRTEPGQKSLMWLRRDSEPPQSESPNTMYLTGMSWTGMSHSTSWCDARKLA